MTSKDNISENLLETAYCDHILFHYLVKVINFTNLFKVYLAFLEAGNQIVSSVNFTIWLMLISFSQSYSDHIKQCPL